MAREWTNQELGEYVSRFTDIQRDNVLKQLLEQDILARFLATSEGRLVLNSVVDGIARDTMEIVRLSISGDDMSLCKMEKVAQRIHAAFSFMHGIATIAITGEDHVAKIRKRRAAKVEK